MDFKKMETDELLQLAAQVDMSTPRHVLEELLIELLERVQLRIIPAE